MVAGRIKGPAPTRDRWGSEPGLRGVEGSVSRIGLSGPGDLAVVRDVVRPARWSR